jgi:hypothetical protein
MDMCPHFPVLCCPVWVEALHQADPLSKVLSNVQNRFINFRSEILNRNSP